MNSTTTIDAAGDPWFFAVTVFFMAVTIGSGLVAFLIARRRRLVHETAVDQAPKPIPVTRNAPPKNAQKFYGVSIQPGINFCPAIEKMRGFRYLTLEAPNLPLPNCSIDDCRCILRPEKDRRAGFDRRDDSFSAYGDYKTHRFEHGRGKRIERRKK